MWFSARAVKREGERQSACGLDRRRDALDRVVELVEPTRPVVVLDRAADGSGFRDSR